MAGGSRGLRIPNSRNAPIPMNSTARMKGIGRSPGGGDTGSRFRFRGRLGVAPGRNTGKALPCGRPGNGTRASFARGSRTGKGVPRNRPNGVRRIRFGGRVLDPWPDGAGWPSRAEPCLLRLPFPPATWPCGELALGMFCEKVESPATDTARGSVGRPAESSAGLNGSEGEEGAAMQAMIRWLARASLAVALLTAALAGYAGGNTFADPAADVVEGAGIVDLLDDGRRWRYEGEWRDDFPQGPGVMTWPDGTRYEGTVDHVGRPVRGVLTMPDGTRYESDYWSEGTLIFAIHGQYGRGVIVDLDGTIEAGLFLGGTLHGQGVMTWPDGRRYEGEFREGRLHGQGVMTWPDGARIEGEWRDGQRIDE